MDDGDDGPATTEANATGILRCLRMLADEAQSLRLTRTRQALDAAMQVCEAEHRSRVGDAPHGPAEGPEPMAAARRMLH